jgi:hypothetical protein
VDLANPPDQTWRGSATVHHFGLVHTTLRVGIVLYVALEGILAFKCLQIIQIGLRHGDAFRTPNSRVADQVNICRAI